MIEVFSIIILVTFAVINSGLLYYFIRKYQETKLRTSLYWVVTYLFFVIALLISIVLAFQEGTVLDDIISVQLPFVVLGLTALSLSAISTGILGGNSKIYEMIVGALGILAFILYLVGQSSIASPIFIVISILAVILYSYLAYTGNNPRIAIISIALLLQAVSGRLGATDIITTNTQLIINSLSQIAIAVGLLGIGLKKE